MDKTIKKVKIVFYDGINTICPFLCPTCGKPVLMIKCPNCGQLLEFPKIRRTYYGKQDTNM